jgi:DNA-nicking Smr family endonuclease
MAIVSARKRARPPPRDPFDPLDGPVDHTMDLHGLRAAEARAWVTSTVDSLARHRPGALLHIITGRGRGSAGGPVLQRTIGTLLRSGQLRHVETWATDLDGGGYVVRLKGRT